MKIAVISANGRSGKVFVETALLAGHTVRAGVYGQHDFPAHDNLEIMQCDATNVDNIKQLIFGQEAVVSLIGHTKNTPKNVQTNAITNVVKSVGSTGVKIISLTGTGVRFPGDAPSLMDRFLNFGIAQVDPARIRDGIDHAQVLKRSDTNWTLLRVLKLTNGRTTKYKLTTTGPAKNLTSRLEVALAILEVLKSDQYIKKAPVISKNKR